MTPTTALQNTGPIPVMRLDNTDPALLDEMLEAVARIARKGAFSMGPELEAFEAEFEIGRAHV